MSLSALAIVLLTGCGTTISSKKVSPTASFDRLSSTLKWKKVEAEAREAFEESGIIEEIARDPSSAILKLADWSKGDPRRLQMASAGTLDRVEKLARKGEDLKAAGYCLTAADLAYQSLAAADVPVDRWLTETSTAASIDLYNHALGRFVALIGERRPDVIEAAIGTYNITWPDVPYDELVVTGEYVYMGFGEKPPVPEPGVGVSLIGINQPGKFHTPRGALTSLSAVAEFALGVQGGEVPRDVEFFLLDQVTNDAVEFLGGSINREVNYAAGVGRALDGLNDRKMGLGGFLFASKRYEQAGIYMIEPYDPTRIPVLFSHGLQSSPLIWRTMIVDLMRDEELRKNYQFWLYYYPSGIPVAVSGGILRDSLADIRATYDPEGDDPVSTNMVAVGHSMGGILTRSLIKDVKDGLWNEISDKPFEELNLDQDELEEFRKIVFWDADPAVTRALFFSAPHRGATMADGFLGRLGMKLVHLPSTVLGVYSDFKNAAEGMLIGSAAKSRAFNSIGSLSPDSPMAAALDAAPYKDGVIFHTVVGDRGKGDTPDSSDGIVAYWSSHLDDAESELIVPTGHSSYLSPLSFAETKRILRDHLKN